MAAPTNAANVKKALANSEGTKHTSFCNGLNVRFGGKAGIIRTKRSCLLMTQSGHSPKLGYASGTFGVHYHQALDFFRITGALRCKAYNFFGYDFN